VLNGLSLGGNVLTLNGSGQFNFSGSISGVGGGITLGGTATATLSGGNSYTGDTIVNPGTTLNINKQQRAGQRQPDHFWRRLTIRRQAASSRRQCSTVEGRLDVRRDAEPDLQHRRCHSHHKRAGDDQRAGHAHYRRRDYRIGIHHHQGRRGTMALNGVIGTTTGGLAVTGGTLIVGSAANTFTGNVTVDGATSVLQMTSGSNGNASSAPLGIFTGGTAYKTVTLTNGATFRPMATYDANVPSATLQGDGYVFNIGSGGGTFDVRAASISHSTTVPPGSREPASPRNSCRAAAR